MSASSFYLIDGLLTLLGTPQARTESRKRGFKKGRHFQFSKSRLGVTSVSTFYVSPQHGIRWYNDDTYSLKDPGVSVFHSQF